MRIHKLNLVGLLLAGALLAGCQGVTTPAASQAQSGNSAGAAPAAPAALTERVVAASTTVAVDGELALATPLISAVFDSAGKVTAVNVVPGQAVKKGDVLAELDGTALNTALQKAQENVALKQAQIESSLVPATQAEINTAKAALSAAYAAYNEVKQGASTHDVEAALRSWNQAKNGLYSAQLNRDQACAKKENTCEQAELGVKSAELGERRAYQAYLDAQQPAGQTDLTKAWSNVVQAKASLAGLQNGVSEEQKQAYDLQLKQANAAVERAQRDLAKAHLISPCDCVVQEVTLSPGASSEDRSIALLDTSQVRFRTTNLSERDVIKLQAGQPATIRLKAFDQTLTGAVDAILPLTSGTQGTVALFTAIVDIDPTEAALRPGMTGQAEIDVLNQLAAAPTSSPAPAAVAGASVSANGELALAVPEISVGFDVNGTVATVNASLGQTVKKGDVLATIDDASLQDSVVDAQLALELVESSIRLQTGSATDEEVAAAQAALSAAYASYSETKAGTSQSEIDRARSSAESAWLSYLSAQSSRDIACGSDKESTRCKSAEASYGNAYESLLAARDSNQKVLEPVSQSTLAQAYTSVASAKSRLESLTAGLTEEQKKVVEVQLSQAQTALNRAEDDLDQAKLISPCDCIVQEANVAVGATAPNVAFRLVDVSSLQFRTTNLVERDVAKIQVGAPVSVRLKAYSDQLTGKVIAVLNQSSGTQNGSALFTVLIDLDPTQLKLLPGMTGQAEITIEQ